MGQSNSSSSSPSSSACKDFIPTVQFQIKKHTKIFSDLNNLTYDGFKQSINELNELSRKCIDDKGNQLVFAISKGSDQVQVLWKACVKIACVCINPETRKILSIKLINLRQFLHIFNTMVTNLEAIEAIEEKRRSASSSPTLYPETVLDQINADNDDEDLFEECAICLDSKKPDLILACMHSFCSNCIAQWNECNLSKKCPICDENSNENNSWIKLEIPEIDEINEEIVNQLQKIANA